MADERGINESGFLAQKAILYRDDEGEEKIAVFAHQNSHSLDPSEVPLDIDPHDQQSAIVSPLSSY